MVIYGYIRRTSKNHDINCICIAVYCISVPDQVVNGANCKNTLMAIDSSLDTTKYQHTNLIS